MCELTVAGLLLLVSALDQKLISQAKNTADREAYHL